VKVARSVWRGAVGKGLHKQYLAGGLPYYQIVRLWERPAEELLAAGPGVAPLAMLGRLPEGLSLEAVAQQLVARLQKEVSPEQLKSLLTDALLLTGLRVRRDVAAKIFRGVRAMQESDTYLAILDEGKESFAREVILLQGEDRFGPPEESVRAQLNTITDLERLKRMVRHTPKATGWQEILDTP